MIDTCIYDFNSDSLPPIPNCPCPTHPQPWAMQGVVSWVGEGSGSFDIEIEQNIFGVKKENYRFEISSVPLPNFLAVGNTVLVSFDGEKSRVELVKKA